MVQDFYYNSCKMQSFGYALTSLFCLFVVVNSIQNRTVDKSSIVLNTRNRVVVENKLFAEVVMWLHTEQSGANLDVKCEHGPEGSEEKLQHWFKLHLNKTDIWKAFDRVSCSYSDAHGALAHLFFDVIQYLPTFDYLIGTNDGRIFSEPLREIAETIENGGKVVHIRYPTPPGFADISIIVQLNRDSKPVNWKWSMYDEQDNEREQITQAIQPVVRSASNSLGFASSRGIRFAYLFPKNGITWAHLYVSIRDFTNSRLMTEHMQQVVKRMKDVIDSTYQIANPSVSLNMDGKQTTGVTIKVTLRNNGTPISYDKQSILQEDQGETHDLRETVISQVRNALYFLEVWSSDTLIFEKFYNCEGQLCARLSMNVNAIDANMKTIFRRMLTEKSQTVEYQLTRGEVQIVRREKPERSHLLLLDAVVQESGTAMSWDISLTRPNDVKAAVLRDLISDALNEVFYRYGFRSDDILEFWYFMNWKNRLRARFVVKSYHLPDEDNLIEGLKIRIEDIVFLSVYKLVRPRIYVTNTEQYYVGPLSNISRRIGKRSFA